MDIFNLKPKFEVPVIEERPHGNTGRTPNEETRCKIGESLKGRRRGPLSEETRCKMSKAARDRTLLNSGVGCMKPAKKVHTPHGVFYSVAEAGRMLDCHVQTVSNRIKNKKNPKFADWFFIEETE